MLSGRITNRFPEGELERDKAASCWIIGLWMSSVLVLPIDTRVSDLSWETPRGLIRDVLAFAGLMGGYPIHVLFVMILLSWPKCGHYLVGYSIPLVGQGLAVGILKFVIGRGRPALHQGAFVFDPLGGPGLEMTSFPSGDATAAMTLATILGFYFPRSRHLFWLMGMAAGLGRVASGRHFLSDVFFGAGLGIAIAYLAHWHLGASYYQVVLLSDESALWRRPPVSNGLGPSHNP